MKATILMALVTMTFSTTSFASYRSLKSEEAKILVAKEDLCTLSIENKCSAGGLDAPGGCLITVNQQSMDTGEESYFVVYISGSQSLNDGFSTVGESGGEFGVGNVVIGGTTAILYQPFKLPSYLAAKSSANKFTKELKATANYCNAK